MAAMRQPSQDTVSSAESADHGGRAASASGHHHHPTRARRNPIAAQACETCRARKTRCNETRPRCGLCERLDLRCVYREPRLTKKDKTAETLLAAVQRIDGKLDRILEAQQPPPWNEASETLTVPDPMLVDAAAGVQRQQQYRRPSHAPDESELRGALSVFPWPAVQALLVDGDGAATADLQGILAEGSGWLLRHEMLSGPAGALPCDSFLSGSNVHVVRADREQSRIVFPSLTPAIMDRYARAYFASYNLIYPVLDRESFIHGALPVVQRHGFAEGCLESLLALLVFALGALACEGVDGKPLAEGSGIRGGTAERPPALGIFNEARGRAGFVLGSCTLENAQAMMLMAIERAWDSHGIDMIRRVYWTCNVIESWYYLDLNLPRSDAVGFQDFIALPDFDDHRDFEGDPAIEKKYRYSFLSMVSLRRLIHRAFDELYGPGKTRTDGATIADQTLVIAELLHQLDGWRTMLPPELRWDDSARASYATVAADTEAATASSTAPSPVHVDILLAQLRCRYYYARFTILRPYLWRALHAPPGALALGPAAVLDGFVGAVDAMLQWPVAYEPVAGKKRLIPNMFAWSQSFLMFLLVLRVVRANKVLMALCEERLGEGRVEESVVVMVGWLRDTRRLDGVAEWAWRTLEGMYGLEE
ncbi:hypothetical protein BK809_0000339 [Diplodia seriata]|uniref:Zn(2)-C6 fungal-type domain-containing protein n=1 Tax=Diplodia seriata TaxID=420778 RepID=A0A1S8B9T2_9PEZI|nr:hypothetical protein BK809_0000339 [Diplodia seriata]